MRGMCGAAVKAMVLEFPELRACRGHVDTAESLRPEPHWWCEDARGNVVDPTASQFGLILGYREHEGPEPVGKCLGCGGYVFAPRSHFCSDNCEAGGF